VEVCVSVSRAALSHTRVAVYATVR
jgi:hypothetical protein